MSVSGVAALLDFFNKNRDQLTGILTRLKKPADREPSGVDLYFANKLQDVLNLSYPLAVGKTPSSDLKLLLEVNKLIVQRKKQSDAAKAAAASQTSSNDTKFTTDHLYNFIESTISIIKKYKDDPSEKSALTEKLDSLPKAAEICVKEIKRLNSSGPSVPGTAVGVQAIAGMIDVCRRSSRMLMLARTGDLSLLGLLQATLQVTLLALPSPGVRSSSNGDDGKSLGARSTDSSMTVALEAGAVSVVKSKRKLDYQELAAEPTMNVMRRQRIYYASPAILL